MNASCSGVTIGPDRRSELGLTMVELLVAVALMVILMGVIAFIFVQARRTVAVTSNRVDTFSHLRYFFEILERDARRMIRVPVSELEVPSSTNPTRSWPFILSATTYVPTGAPLAERVPTRSDEIAFLIYEHTGDAVRPAYVRYRLEGTDRRYPSLVREVTYLSDSFTRLPDDEQPPLETILAKVRELRLSWFEETEAGSIGSYSDPGTPAGEGATTQDGSAFYITGTGDLRTDDDFVPDIPTVQVRRLQRGGVVYLRRDGEDRPQPYRIKRIDRDGAQPVIELVQHQPQASDIFFLIHLYPPSIRVQVRTMEAENASRELVTRIITLPQ